MLRLFAASGSRSASAVLHARLFATEAKKAINVSVKDGVAIVRFDDPNSKVNTLNRQLNDEFASAVDMIRNSPDVKAAVLISGKPDNFIAGADISMLANCKSAEEVYELSRAGQKMLDLLASSPRPVVAAINGSCLGGGLEVALACHYRVATNSSKTQLGLPEVQLGLLPGAGGTQRLPRLVGLLNALPLITTGKKLNASSAKKVGLVDVVVQPLGPGIRSADDNTVAYLEQTAVSLAQELASGKLRVNREPDAFSLAGIKKYLTEQFSYGRDFIFQQARKQAQKASGGHYPAVFGILDSVATGLAKGVEAGQEFEAKRFSELSRTSQSRALMGLYFGSQKARKNEYKAHLPQTPVNSIAVIGAGLMGAGVAEVSLKNFDVTLVDTKPEGLGRGVKQIYTNLNKQVKRKKETSFNRDQILTTKLHPQLNYSDHFPKAQVIIEAVFEDINLKKRIVNDVEAVTGPNTIFASNTSALPIGEIAKASKRPENVVGMHYFSPVDKMPLLEVIRHSGTSKSTLAIAVDVGLRQGKHVIVVGDGPGFYTTRILAPMLAETLSLLAGGVEIPRIDKAMRSYGFPVGPATLADEVGIDVGYHISKFLNKAFAARMDPEAAKIGVDVLAKMTEANFLGRKSGKGLYLWDERSGSDKKVNEAAVEILKSQGAWGRAANYTNEDIQLRLVSLLVNESILCLQEGILTSPVDGDIGAVFGLGFPPFHGGPFRWTDSFGAAKLVEYMESMSKKYGKHFEPAALLREHAKNGTKFHAQ